MTLRRSMLPMLMLLLSSVIVHAAEVAPPDAIASVFRVAAFNGNGHATNGSAVLIAPGKLVTACHVTRSAKSIVVGRDKETWQAIVVAGSEEHDLCFLSAPDLMEAAPARIGTPEQLRLGDPVIAIGFPRGKALAVTRGHVKGLHAHDGARVLQVSTFFDHGQSGGALVDADGHLVGITAFKAIAGGNFHFALPLAWLQDAEKRVTVKGKPQSNGPAFWERSRTRQPLFIKAASLEADRNWKALSGVAENWVLVDATNPASWLCLARVLLRLEREQDAMRAIEQAKELEPVLDAIGLQ